MTSDPYRRSVPASTLGWIAEMYRQTKIPVPRLVRVFDASSEGPQPSAHLQPHGVAGMEAVHAVVTLTIMSRQLAVTTLGYQPSVPLADVVAALERYALGARHSGDLRRMVEGKTSGLTFCARDRETIHLELVPPGGHACHPRLATEAIDACREAVRIGLLMQLARPDVEPWEDPDPPPPPG